MDYLLPVALFLLLGVGIYVLIVLNRIAKEKNQGEELRQLAATVQSMAQDLQRLTANQEQLRLSLQSELSQSRQEQQQVINSQMQTLSSNLVSQQGGFAELQEKRLLDISNQLGIRQESLQKTLIDLMQQQNQGSAQSFSLVSESLEKSITELNMQLGDKLTTLQNTVSQLLRQMEERLQAQTTITENGLEQNRQTIERRLTALQEENSAKLEQMRNVVDEKLQKTLEERIGQSFKLVSERLEQVYKSLGEMQTLAAGVGDLQRVLSNVKTRGILGEIQLGAILEQILTREQYFTNVATRPGSSQVVEYAIRLPGDDQGEVLLPIDAKFPADAYSRLMEAYEQGKPEDVEAAGAALERTIRSFARDIHDKYVEPPFTTDFAVMFLPFEGLYAEVVRRGVLESLQRDYQVSIAGPTTMAAFLNSLQMGFRTLAIQKRSSEVWRVLGAVKTEFGRFNEVLQATQKRLEQANKELENLVGTRTRQIQRRLSSVTELPEGESKLLLEEPEQD